MQNHQCALTIKRCDRCHCTHLHSDAIAAHAHMHTHNLHNDTIAAGAYTYTTIQSLPLHKPTQRYDRCHCMHLHSDTIAANAHASTAIRSLFLNTPIQRCNRCLAAIRSLPRFLKQTHTCKLHFFNIAARFLMQATHHPCVTTVNTTASLTEAPYAAKSHTTCPCFVSQVSQNVSPSLIALQTSF